MKFNTDLSTYASKIFKDNVKVGWWDEGDARCLYTVLQLISTEVAEATEGLRKNLPDDKLPQYPMHAVELADALIRALDLAGYWRDFYGKEFSILENSAYHSYAGPNCSPGKQLLGVNSVTLSVAYLLDEISKPTSKLSNYDLVPRLGRAVSYIMGTILQIAENNDYPLEEIMLAKLEFNRTRADHKRENREKVGGKKF